MDSTNQHPSGPRRQTGHNRQAPRPFENRGPEGSHLRIEPDRERREVYLTHDSPYANITRRKLLIEEAIQFLSDMETLDLPGWGTSPVPHAISWLEQLRERRGPGNVWPQPLKP